MIEVKMTFSSLEEMLAALAPTRAASEFAEIEAVSQQIETCSAAVAVAKAREIMERVEEPVTEEVAPAADPTPIAASSVSPVSVDDEVLPDDSVADIAAAEEIDNDTLQKRAREWVGANGGQKAVVALQKLLHANRWPQVSVIPQAQRAWFLGELAQIAL